MYCIPCLRNDHQQHVRLGVCDCNHDAASWQDIDEYYNFLMRTAKKFNAEESIRRFFNRTSKPEKKRSQVLLDVEFLP